MHDSRGQRWGARETPSFPYALQNEASRPTEYHIWKWAGNSNHAPLLGNVSNPLRDLMEAGNTWEGGGPTPQDPKSAGEIQMSPGVHSPQSRSLPAPKEMKGA